MKATKYDKVKTLPKKALPVSQYAEQIGQKNPAYICIAYDRHLAKPDKCADPGYTIVNWQGINFVIPN